LAALLAILSVLKSAAFAKTIFTVFNRFIFLQNICVSVFFIKGKKRCFNCFASIKVVLS